MGNNKTGEREQGEEANHEKTVRMMALRRHKNDTFKSRKYTKATLAELVACSTQTERGERALPTALDFLKSPDRVSRSTELLSRSRSMQSSPPRVSQAPRPKPSLLLLFLSLFLYFWGRDFPTQKYSWAWLGCCCWQFSAIIKKWARLDAKIVNSARQAKQLRKRKWIFTFFS